MENNRILKFALVYACTFFILSLCSCRDSKEVTEMKDAIIVAYGQYLTKEKYTIHVDENPAGILFYTVKTTDGTVLIDSQTARRVGVFQKWRFLWDHTSESLWIDSSDIGLYAWIKNDKGVFEFTLIRPRDRIEIKNIVPELLWDSLNLRLIDSD